MKLTIDIQEHKLAFFLELLKSFEDFVTVETESEELSDKHKAILDQRLNHYSKHPEDVVDWQVLKAQLKEQI